MAAASARIAKVLFFIAIAIAIVVVVIAIMVGQAVF